MLPVASSTVFAFIAAYGILPAQAQLKPTAPGPNETFTAGSPCGVAWTPDSTGTWTNVTIDLMSGSNSNMSLVTNVATALDGTNKSLTPYSWTCPDVDPYSTIYFYQFTNGADTSTRTWTMRFTISSLSNETNPPENSQQPNGDPVPWGIGHLSSKADSSTASSSVDVGEDDDDAQNSFALPTASESPSNTRHHKAFSDADSADGPDDDDNADSSDEEDNGSHEEDNADGSHEEDNADGSHDEDNADGSGEEDNTDGSGEEDNTDGPDDDDSASPRSPAIKTRTANISGPTSATMAHRHGMDSDSGSSDSEDDSDGSNSDSYAPGDSEAGNDGSGPSDANTDSNYDSGTSAGTGEKGAGTADSAGEASGCRCYAAKSTAIVLVSNMLAVAVPSVMSALVVVMFL